MIESCLADILTPSHSQSARLNLAYRRAIRVLLATLEPQWQLPLSVFSKMRGLFPADVIRYEAGRRFLSGDPQNQTVAVYDPQLHALHYEWYFTQSTAMEISHECVSRDGLTICMGVPTIASSAIEKRRDVILIDDNRRVLDRFPELVRASEIHLMDASKAQRLSVKADTLVFDSPWYLGDLLAWLVVASHLVKTSGTIFFGLYPQLLRPTAGLERDLILEVAAAIGKTDVTEDALAYRTPLFEWEALKACGLREVGDWRRGDLVAITACRPLEIALPSLTRRADIDGLWSTFVIGSQVIKLRCSSSGASNEASQALLSEIEGSFILPSVSVRDSRRDAVQVWTSNNRVAGSADSGALFRIFQRLESGIRLKEAVRPYQRRFGKRVEHQMREFLLLET